MGLAFLVALVSALVIALFKDQIAGAYSSDAVVAALAAHLLVFAALFQLPDAVQVSTSLTFRRSTDAFGRNQARELSGPIDRGLCWRP